MVPDFMFYHVDVRDVAAAHCIAMAKEHVEGRQVIIASTANLRSCIFVLLVFGAKEIIIAHHGIPFSRNSFHVRFLEFYC